MNSDSTTQHTDNAWARYTAATVLLLIGGALFKVSSETGAQKWGILGGVLIGISFASIIAIDIIGVGR